MTAEMPPSQFNLNEGWKKVEAQAREIIASDDPYNSQRMDAFIKQACRPSCLGRDFKPLPQDRSTFINALLSRHLEETDGLATWDKTRVSRIAELALIMDGLYGLDYPALGKLYRPHISSVINDGSYSVWQRKAVSTAKLVKSDLEHQ